MRNSSGRFTVVDEHGEEVLRSPDPLAQAQAAYLAAAAPGLRKALEVVTRRLLSLEPPYTRDHERIRMARGELGETLVPMEELRRVIPLRDQLELKLDR